MSNFKRNALYAGVTNNLKRRVWEHKNKVYPNNFTARYNVDKLVYYEVCGDAISMINREKQIKNLVRRKKIELIEKDNPGWQDLSLEWE